MGSPGRKRIHDETAALQLLELAGKATKRPRTETGSSRDGTFRNSLQQVVTTTMTTTQEDAAQFEDASSGESATENEIMSKTAAPGTLASSLKSDRHDIIEGQFDDASEPESPEMQRLQQRLCKGRSSNTAPRTLNCSSLSVIRGRKLPLKAPAAHRPRPMQAALSPNNRDTSTSSSPTLPDRLPARMTTTAGSYIPIAPRPAHFPKEGAPLQSSHSKIAPEGVSNISEARRIDGSAGLNEAVAPRISERASVQPAFTSHQNNMFETGAFGLQPMQTHANAPPAAAFPRNVSPQYTQDVFPPPLLQHSITQRARNLTQQHCFIPIAPRAMTTHGVVQASQKGLGDGPFLTHPSPLLEPDSGVQSSSRFGIATSVLPDLEKQQNPIREPLATDILLGRGSRSNFHAGNIWFRDFIHSYRPTYHRVEKFNKMQLASNLVNYVRHCGGRFLQKAKSGEWFEVGDVRARDKCSQCLREPLAASSSIASVGDADSSATAGSASSSNKASKKAPPKTGSGKSGKQARRVSAPVRRRSSASTTTNGDQQSFEQREERRDDNGDDDGDESLVLVV